MAQSRGPRQAGRELGADLTVSTPRSVRCPAAAGVGDAGRTGARDEHQGRVARCRIGGPLQCWPHCAPSRRATQPPAAARRRADRVAALRAPARTSQRGRPCRSRQLAQRTDRHGADTHPVRRTQAATPGTTGVRWTIWKRWSRGASSITVVSASGTQAHALPSSTAGHHVVAAAFDSIAGSGLPHAHGARRARARGRRGRSG